LSYNGHSGYDYSYSKNTVIHAPADGTLWIPANDTINGNSWQWVTDPVTGETTRGPSCTSPWGGWHTFYIDHGNRYTTWFLHSDRLYESLTNPLPNDDCRGSKLNAPIKIGEVKRGDPVAYSGNFAYGQNGGVSDHVHFEVRLNGQVIDPYGWEGISADPIAKTKDAATNQTNLWGMGAPVVSRISPEQTAPGSFSITVTGGTFDSGASVEIWYESDLAGNNADGHFVGTATLTDRSANQLVATVNITNPGKYLVKAKNASGPRSNSARLTLTN